MVIKKLVVGALQTNCYLLVDGGELAVVDPGDEAEKIVAEIEKTGAVVKFVINTHNHFDHTGANVALEDRYNVKVLSNLKDGDVLELGNSRLRVMAAPGHTPEGICLFGGGFVISGDTLFDGGIGRTDLPGGSDKDMAASLKKLDGLVLEYAMVYPGHGDIFNYKEGMALEWAECLNK
jgi:glyoxylase-like metal-dependent hydrolase (beta-lactamase superfamily II)